MQHASSQVSIQFPFHSGEKNVTGHSKLVRVFEVPSVLLLVMVILAFANVISYNSMLILVE